MNNFVSKLIAKIAAPEPTDPLAAEAAKIRAGWGGGQDPAAPALLPITPSSQSIQQAVRALQDWRQQMLQNQSLQNAAYINTNAASIAQAANTQALQNALNQGSGGGLFGGSGGSHSQYTQGGGGAGYAHTQYVGGGLGSGYPYPLVEKFGLEWYALYQHEYKRACESRVVEET